MIPNWLLQRAHLTPNRIALHDETEAVSFAELHERAVKRARQLAYLGVKKGDVVAVLMKNSVHMVEIIHAIQYIGAIALLQNVRLSVEEVRWQLEHSGARFIVCDESFPDERAVKIVHRLPLSISFIHMNKLIPCDRSFIRKRFITNNETGSAMFKLPPYFLN